MRLPLVLVAIRAVSGGKFLEIQGVLSAPGTPFGDSLTGTADSCKDACQTEQACDCVLFNPVHGSCKLQSDCLYFNPDFEEGGPLELYIKLPPQLQGFSVFPNTKENSGSVQVGGHAEVRVTITECADRCAMDVNCACAVIEAEDTWSSASNRCWLRSNCDATAFRRDAQSFMTLMKDVPGKPPLAFISVDDAAQTRPAESSNMDILVFVLLLLLLLCVAVAVVVLFFLRTKWKYRALASDLSVPKEEAARRDFAKEELMKSFESKSAVKFLSSLELALDAKVSDSDIPCVYSLQRMRETFKVPKVDSSKTSLTVQLCFILDYTGSMKTQIAQAKQSVTKIVESMKALKIPSMPNAQVEVMMTAVAYNDWDEETKKKGRPVVSVFGGKEMKQQHDPSLSKEAFNLGGSWTEDTAALQKWIDQDLGHGGKVPEELTGGLLAASYLEWIAEEKLAIVITDAPCHGKAYSSAEHDGFCDKETGLTCTGRPEVPLQSLMEKGVTTVILHTGETAAVTMCKKLQETDPMLLHEKVSPEKTAERVISVLSNKVQVQPLCYKLKALNLEDQKPNGQFLCEGPQFSDAVVSAELEVDVGGNKVTLNSSNDGLVFVGKNASGPKVTLSRPPEGELDNWFEGQSEEVQLERFYDATKSYVLKVPVKTT